MSQKYTWLLLDFHVNTTDLTECGTEDRLKREEAFIGQHWLHAVSYASKIFGILHFCKEKHQTSLNTNSAFCSSLILSVSNTLFFTFFTFLAFHFFGILHFCKGKQQTPLNTTSAFCSGLLRSVSHFSRFL